jgi:hypothetical protein
MFSYLILYNFVSARENLGTDEKFGWFIDQNYSPYLDVIGECKQICRYFLDGFSKQSDPAPIIKTAIQMEELTLEYIDSVLLNLRRGFITQAIVLVRSLYELSNLYTYVYMNEEHHKAWLKEKWINPNIIRRTLKKHGFDTGREVYRDLSKFTHANYEFVNEHHNVFVETRVNDIQKALVPRTMVNLMRFLMRICLISCKIYAEHIEKAPDVIRLKNEQLDHLQENVLQLGEDQAKTEDEYSEFKILLERIKSRHFEEDEED